MSAIIRRGRYYWVDLWVGKKRVRRSLHVQSKAEALALYAQTREKILAQHGRAGTSWESFRRQYMEWAWASKPASAEQEELRVAIIIEFFTTLGVLHLDDVTPFHVEKLKAELTARKRSPATVNRYLQLLRGMFYRAIDWEVYHKPNPLRRVKFYREERERRALTDDEVRRIVEAARAMKARSPLQRAFADMLTLAAYTGLRKCEVLNLRWRDVRGDELSVIGKGKRRRVVPLNQTAREALARQRRVTEFVFDLPRRDSGSLFRRTVENIRKATGIEFGFHDLRHYVATAMLARGVDIVTIGKVLGHTTAATTLIYGHSDQNRVREAISALDSQKGMVEGDRLK